MTEKIGGLPRPGTETRPIGNQPAGSAKSTASASQGRSHNAASSDEVSLTDTVTRLKVIESRIQDLPDVDRERVDEIRRQIEAGEFELDAKLIAQRLVQLEQALN